jgi:hypothetical protein
MGADWLSFIIVAMSHGSCPIEECRGACRVDAIATVVSLSLKVGATALRLWV